MRDDREKLYDILEAIERIDKYAVLGRRRFEEDELIQTWFIQHLQIIGEAARALSQATRDLGSDIQWRQIIGMRNVLAHTYFDIDLDVVWLAVTVSVPALKPEITRLLKQLP